MLEYQPQSTVIVVQFEITTLLLNVCTQMGECARFSMIILKTEVSYNHSHICSFTFKTFATSTYKNKEYQERR